MTDSESLTAVKINKKVDAAFVAGIILLLLAFLHFQVTTKAYTVSGAKSWIVYAVFILVALSAFLSVQRAFFLAVFFFALSYSCISFNAKEVSTIELAKVIQTECNSNGECPASLEGWSKVGYGHFRKGNLNYNPPGAFGRNKAEFRLYYHYGPDVDVFIEGGANKDLVISYWR